MYGVTIKTYKKFFSLFENSHPPTASPFLVQVRC